MYSFLFVVKLMRNYVFFMTSIYCLVIFITIVMLLIYEINDRK